MRSDKLGWFRGCAVSAGWSASVWCDNCSDGRGQGEAGPAGNRDVWLTLETVTAPAPSQAGTRPWRIDAGCAGLLLEAGRGSIWVHCARVSVISLWLLIVPWRSCPCVWKWTDFPRRFILKSSVKNVGRVIYPPICQCSPRAGVLPLTQ